jgi:DNA-binding transcriptional LysR family regulator
MLHRFANLNPNLNIKIDEYPDEYPVTDLFQDEADVGIVLGHEGIPNCSYELLRAGRTVIIVSKDHPLSDSKVICLEDLKDLPLVVKTVEPGRENHLDEECKNHGFEPHILYSTGNLTALRNSCIRTGVAAESIDFIESVFPVDEIVVIPLKEKIPQNIYVVSRDRDIQNRAVTLFQTFLKENFTP